MHVIKNIPNADFKITLYGWNHKYIIKIEDEMYEQTYKVSEFDVSSEEKIDKILTEAFLQRVKENFKNMHRALSESIEALDEF